MTKEEICKGRTEAALAEYVGKGEPQKDGPFVRGDNFVPIAFKLRQKCYADAEFAEVGHNLISATFTVQRDGKDKDITHYFYVQ
jgi:hypothetical protein